MNISILNVEYQSLYDPKHKNRIWGLKKIFILDLKRKTEFTSSSKISKLS